MAPAATATPLMLSGNSRQGLFWIRRAAQSQASLKGMTSGVSEFASGLHCGTPTTSLLLWWILPHAEHCPSLGHWQVYGASLHGL